MLMAASPARAALLHHLGPVEARQLAESVIAVDDGPLDNLGVSQEEAGLWEDRKHRQRDNSLEMF